MKKVVTFYSKNLLFGPKNIYHILLIFQYGEEFYEDMRGVFHPCDSNYLLILEYMYERKVSETSVCKDKIIQRTWKEALEIGEQILEAYKKLYPRYDVNTSLMSLKLGKIASYLEDDMKARGTFIL